jgi:cytochrome c553
MNTKFIIPMIGLFLLCVLGNSHSKNINNGEFDRAVCGGCHGDDGNSTHPSSPSLAGQNTAYLIQQLNAFNNGTREHPERINDTHIEALAAYYSSLIPVNTVAPVSANQHEYDRIIKQGEEIYSACSGCHGMQGEGIAPYPRLVGQQPDYLKQQLTNFKTGARNGKIMKMMVVNLSDNDINALALYLANLNELQTGANALPYWK